MECRRCGGEGTLTIKLGKPDPKRDTHASYGGMWCVYPPRTCGHCHGKGQERDKPPPAPYQGAIKIHDLDDTARWL